VAMLASVEEWLPRTAALAREAALFVRIVTASLWRTTPSDDGLDWSPFSGACGQAAQAKTATARTAMATATAAAAAAVPAATLGYTLGHTHGHTPGRRGGGGGGGQRVGGTRRRLPQCLEPITLRGVTLKNRVIRAAAFGGADLDDLIRTHVEVARGGVAMTTVAYAAVSPTARTFASQVVLTPDAVQSLRTLTDAVHAAGAKIAVQLTHAGSFAGTFAAWR
jgi:hypothetical protein